MTRVTRGRQRTHRSLVEMVRDLEPIRDLIVDFRCACKGIRCVIRSPFFRPPVSMRRFGSLRVAPLSASPRVYATRGRRMVLMCHRDSRWLSGISGTARVPEPSGSLQDGSVPRAVPTRVGSLRNLRTMLPNTSGSSRKGKCPTPGMISSWDAGRAACIASAEPGRKIL